MKEIRNDDRATSGNNWVYSGILMIAITIVLSAYFFTGPHPWERSKESSPTLGTVTRYNDTGYFMWVDKVDSRKTVHLNEISYYIEDHNGTRISEAEFPLIEIMNLDTTDNETNISFLDNDHDGNLSTGDSLYIRDIEHGGYVEEGFSVFFIYEPTGKKMNRIGAELKK